MVKAGKQYVCRGVDKDGRPIMEEVETCSPSSVPGRSKESKVRRSLERLDPSKPQVIAGNLKTISKRLRE